MEKEKLKKLSLNLSSNRENYMESFRRNISMYIAEKDITLREVAEVADIPFSTLNNFIYGDSKDCKLSTAVALAHAFGVSIDELVGAETIEPLTRESIALCRNLPENALYLVRWYIKHQAYMNQKIERGKTVISVMQVQCNHNGNMKLTNDYKPLDITDLDKELSCKIFFGVKMPCDHYMPKYSPYDVILIANDRTPMATEDCLIDIGGSLFIARRRVEDGVAKYYSIRDGRYRMDEDGIDELVGYIAAVKSLEQH